MTPETGDGDERVDRPATDYAGSSSSTLDADRLRTYLLYAALAVCALLALVATVNFYSSASQAISVWVDDRYQPLYQAAFNLVVLLAAGIGISLITSRL